MTFFLSFFYENIILGQVICRRGVIARVEKGSNVLAGGAGGMVLINDVEDGNSVPVDVHFLPAVALGFTAGEQLLALLTPGLKATITGVDLTIGPHGELARFSSRGPIMEENFWSGVMKVGFLSTENHFRFSSFVIGRICSVFLSAA